MPEIWRDCAERTATRRRPSPVCDAACSGAGFVRAGQNSGAFTMSIELQLRASVLVELTRRTLRRALATTCLPAGSGFSIDHLEVAGSTITISQVGNAVEMQVPIEVFIVTDADLFSKANVTPQGATTPAGTMVVPVRLEAQTEDEPLADGSGTRRRIWLRLVPQQPTFGHLETPLGPLGPAIRDAISGRMPVERTEITRLVDILEPGNLGQVRDRKSVV